jgi:hypothetical protein
MESEWFHCAKGTWKEKEDKGTLKAAEQQKKE